MVFGDSESFQGQDNWSQLVAGTGQENGAGPHIWAAVSMPLFEVFCKEGLIASVIGAMSKMQRALAGLHSWMTQTS